MNNVVKTSAIPTKMDTKEIAGLTGKEHKQVLRDTRVMLITLFGSAHVDSVIPADKLNQRARFIWDNLDELFGAVFSDGVKLHHEQNQGFTVHRDKRGYLASVDLDRSLTLTLVSGYDIHMRNRIIKRLEELETAAAASPADIMATLENPAALRQALLSYTEKVGVLEHQVADLAPKAAALEQISASRESLTLTQASKVLGVKLDELTTFMHEKGWVYRQNGSWLAYEKHIRSGDLKYKEARYTDEKTEQGVLRPYCHILPKGLTKLASLLNCALAEA